MQFHSLISKPNYLKQVVVNMYELNVAHLQYKQKKKGRKTSVIIESML